MSSSEIECWACGEIGHRFEKCPYNTRKMNFVGKKEVATQEKGGKRRGRREKHPQHLWV